MIWIKKEDKKYNHYNRVVVYSSKSRKEVTLSIVIERGYKSAVYRVGGEPILWKKFESRSITAVKAYFAKLC